MAKKAISTSLDYRENMPRNVELGSIISLIFWNLGKQAGGTYGRLSRLNRLEDIGFGSTGHKLGRLEGMSGH